MRIIDADALMPLFIEKACTMKDRHGVKLGDEWLLNYNDIKGVIDNAPTVSIDNTGYSQGFKDGKECTLVSIDAIEDITDRMVSIISEIDWEKAIEAYKARPQEWILISERLPDRFEDVLITYQIPNREPKVRRALYVGGKFNFDNGDTWNWNDPEIKAWMPLPEAYKEAENDY